MKLPATARGRGIERYASTVDVVVVEAIGRAILAAEIAA